MLRKVDLLICEMYSYYIKTAEVIYVHDNKRVRHTVTVPISDSVYQVQGVVKWTLLVVSSWSISGTLLNTLFSQIKYRAIH